MRSYTPLGIALSCIAAFCIGDAAGQEGIPDEIQSGLRSMSGDRLLKDIQTLASDEFEGRAPGSHGEALTVNYLVDRFRHARLRPGNPDGTFVQRVPVLGISSTVSATLSSPRMAQAVSYPDDVVFRALKAVSNVALQRSPVVFAGYGIVAPEYRWDDFKGTDVRGKTLIVLDGEPGGSAFKGDLQTYYSTRSYKFEAAAKRGAAAVLVVNEQGISYATFKAIANSHSGESFVPQSAGPALDAQGWISSKGMDRLCRAAGSEFFNLKRRASNRAFRPIELGATASITASKTIRSLESRNVVAKVEGSDSRLRNQFVVYTAHWDHLGRNRSLKGDTIFNGAIDNAAGVAQLLQIAQGFVKLRPRRSILFIATTGEEKGFLGARYYCSRPLYPVARTVANINLDACNMWGRTSDVTNLAFGLSDLDDVLARAAKMQGRSFLAEPFAQGSYMFLSDQIEFAKAGIPAAFPGSGSHYVGQSPTFGDIKWGAYGAYNYHQVSDEYQPDWDPRGAIEDAQWLLIAGYLVAQADRVPQWRQDAEFRRAQQPIR